MSNINPTIDAPYIQLLNRIMNNGVDSDDRTGVGTLSLFGETMTIDISDNKIPALGVRKTPIRFAFEELMFMLNGKRQTKELEEKNIKIWKGNTTREFLDNRGLNHLEVGDFGRMYGCQLREFNGESVEDQHSETQVVKFDQLEYIVNEIKTNPTSRRIITTHYNPAEADQGVLFPCHIMTQFNVDPRTGELDILFFLRSADTIYGTPINILYYTIFAHMIAKLTGYKARKLVYFAGDCHIYKNQIECGIVEHMIENFNGVGSNQFKEPTIEFLKDFNSIEEMLSLKWEDVKVHNYDPFPDFKNKPPMAV